MEFICFFLLGVLRVYLEKEDVIESVKIGKFVCCDGNNEFLLWFIEKVELEFVNGNIRKILDIL